MNLVINLDKPKGMTSQEAVTTVKKLLHVKKAGHAGTLDPIATGVLLICLNEATKITRFLTDLNKEYIARIKLGERTDTLDSEGRVIERVEGFSFTKEEIIHVLNRFQG
ncbi:MAG: tRNA pseudouridine(55) synthase TruB, partial [Thermodesulfovibrionales bacterium]